MKKRYYLLFLFLVIFLSFLCFYPAFRFAFVIDDWFQLWGVFYDRSIIEYYMKAQHPNSAYEFLLLAPIFKFTPFYYQIVGYLLKVVDSLVVALLIFSITKLKNTAIFSGLLFAASVIGLETFSRISAQNSALSIVVLGTGLYFWVIANRDNSLYKYFLAVIFMGLTILGDPGTGVIILPITLFWNLLNLAQSPHKQTLKKTLITTGVLMLIPLFLGKYLGSLVSSKSAYFSQHSSFILNNSLTVLTNYLTSIGNLIIGWIIPVEEHIGLTNSVPITIISGYLYILFVLIIGFNFLRTRTEYFKIMLFFSIWPLLFYFPSWFTQTHYVEGGTISAVSNRYFAISSIGVIGLIAYYVSSFKNNRAVPFLSLIIILSLWNSFRILSGEYKYRSVEIQQKLYDRIDEDVPIGDEKDKILLFLGNNWVRIVGLDWNGFYPIAHRRGIINTNDFPTIVNDIPKTKDAVCIKTNSVSPKFKLSNLYAWEIQDDSIYNVSENVRKIISSDKECKFYQNND